MGAIYVVRHAQASFGTEDYDRLTETGFAQARLLGAYFALRNIRFDAVYTGTLRRHAETAQGILDGYAEYGDGPPLVRLPALDEYNPEALMSAHTDAVPAPPVAAAGRDIAAVREHFRLLKQALLAWADDRTQPAGMPSFRTFQDGAVAAIVDARSRFAGGSVLVVSSGGPYRRHRGGRTQGAAADRHRAESADSQQLRHRVRDVFAAPSAGELQRAGASRHAARP